MGSINVGGVGGAISKDILGARTWKGTARILSSVKHSVRERNTRPTARGRISPLVSSAINLPAK